MIKVFYKYEERLSIERVTKRAEREKKAIQCESLKYEVSKSTEVKIK